MPQRLIEATPVIDSPQRNGARSEYVHSSSKMRSDCLHAAALALGREHQAELADLHLVAAEQHRRLHRLPVDVRAVEATDVHNLEFVVRPSELRMPAAHGDIVEKDVAARMSAR